MDFKAIYVCRDSTYINKYLVIGHVLYNIQLVFFAFQNLDNILWLMDYTIYSPLEIKINSNTFQWYRKMPGVFAENRKILADKSIEYQESLKKRIEQFRRDLESYWDQVQEYDNWGEIKNLAKYKKKAAVLDARLIQAMEKIDQINEEEAAYGWELSQYPIRKKAHDKLLPYKRLYDAGQEFMEKYDLWMHSQVGTFYPDEIENDVGNINRIVLKLEKQFSDRPNTQKLALDVKIEFILNFCSKIE